MDGPVSACSLVHAFQPRRALQLSGASEMPLGADFDFAGMLLAAGPLTNHGAAQAQSTT